MLCTLYCTCSPSPSITLIYDPQVRHSTNNSENDMDVRPYPPPREAPFSPQLSLRFVVMQRSPPPPTHFLISAGFPATLIMLLLDPVLCTMMLRSSGHADAGHGIDMAAKRDQDVLRRRDCLDLQNVNTC